MRKAILSGILVTVILILIGVLGFRRYKFVKSTKVAGISTQVAAPVTGLILPHHLLADSIVDQSFQKLILEKPNYSSIVLIGPNHFHAGSNCVIASSDYELDFEFGDYISRDSVIIEQEHSIGNLLPYLQHYFPNTPVYPFIIDSFCSRENVYDFSEWLTSNFDKNTLFIASVDFSHNLGLSQGLENNKVSIQAIQNYDFEQIYKFDDYYLDSPHSVVTLLTITKKFGVDSFEILYNTHASLLADSPGLQGTGYVIGIFK